MADIVAVYGIILPVFLAITIRILVQINKYQNDAYMDEIFHVPQAQNYCHGNFHHWDNKITTPPGLYISSQAFLKATGIVIGQATENICTTFNLRLTNVVFVLGCYFVTRKILQKLSNENSKINSRQEHTEHQKINIAAIVITSFPLLYFFTFLYYTDVGSTFFVLLSYYCTTTKNHVLSAVFGSIAIIFRQTNVVWVCFNCASALLTMLKERDVYKSSDTLLHQIWKSVLGCLIEFRQAVLVALPYGFVFLGFIIFIVVNNGIVVGDRSSHEASTHFPQLLYFFAFTCVFGNFLMLKYLRLSYTLSRLLEVITKPSYILFGILAVCCMFLAVHYFTYVHLYLISDNRHYIFYIWNRIFEAHWSVRYALIPGYLLAFLIIMDEMVQTRDSIWILLFLLCTAAVLVPQKLLEFRYFILPYLIFRVHVKMTSWLDLLLEFVTYTCVNFATIYLFVSRTFTQNGLQGQRFMW